MNSSVNQSAQVWLPIVTFIAGAGLGFVSEYLREKRTLRREEAARREVRRLKHNDFQRSTLLALQDAVHAFVRAGTVNMFLHTARLQGRKLNVTAVRKNSRTLMVSGGQVARFESRVADASIRRAAKGLRVVITALEDLNSVAELNFHYQRLTLDAVALMERIGAEIRSLDSPE